ncbi:MAG TPA: GDSL-type esterase/lipase family protein [Acidimicrobiia bacterium]|nr:GDSL-type esterase/lipase family protein [Acidimicrobiia bacterium]
MTRPEQPEPYLRGCAWPGTGAVPYPRADPDDLSRLPIDTVETARVPVGVRFELVGDAEAIEVAYTTRTDDFGYRGPGAGTTFAVVRDGKPVDEQPAVLGEGSVRLGLGGADPSERAVVYLPEGMRPCVHSLVPLGGTIEPAPRQPRWLAYGDSIAEGWIATGPSGAWPAVAGREHDLDTVNLGYAGSARGELVSAEQLARLDADVISISHGTNCWTRIPYSAALFRENTRAFLDLIRAGHRETPIVVTSPVLRPDAESTPNRLGATLADLRAAMEDVVLERMAAGDDRLTLVRGGGLLEPHHLPDGIHPGDEGHQILAVAFGAAVREALETT